MTCECTICGFKKHHTDDFKKWPNIPGQKIEFFPITEDGKPNSKLINFICLKCLGRANRMKSYIQALMAGLVISQHAVRKFIERNSIGIREELMAKKVMLKLFSNGQRIKFSDKTMLIKKLNNNCSEAQYYLFENLIFVVSSGKPKTIVTVFKTEGKKLNQDFFYC